MADKANYYREVTARVLTLRDVLGDDLPPTDRQIVTDYLDHNELGLALDHLVYAIEEYEIAVRPADAEEMAVLADLMDPHHDELQPRVIRALRDSGN